MTPLLKKTALDCNDLKNYRPIGNLPYISKLTERVVSSRLLQFMVTNNLGLHQPFQSAYRPNHSTETALLRVPNNLLLALNGKKVAVLVMLDLSAAFDTMDHTMILQGLSAVSVQGRSLAWFQSYLANRTQSVFIGGQSSDDSDIVYAVPQASVFGPILFTICKEPIGHTCGHHDLDYHLFANDSQLYASFRVNNRNDPDFLLAHIKLCTLDIKIFMSSSRLCMNDGKTEVVVLSSPANRHRFSLSEVSYQSLTVRLHWCLPLVASISLSTVTYADGRANLCSLQSSTLSGAYNCSYPLLARSEFSSHTGTVSGDLQVELW